MSFSTKIAASDSDTISIYGHDLCEDIIGNVNLGDMAFIAAKGNLPSKNESKMLNAIMVSLSEHGFTPSSMAARLTYLGAPEAVQASIAAGLLGAGTVYLGSMESSAKVLQEGLGKDNSTNISKMANNIVDQFEGEKFPGFGHPIHKKFDPRTKKLFELAEELGFKLQHCHLLIEVHKVYVEKNKKHLAINASGAVAAILSDMGFDWGIVKCFALAARAVGLIGHILEEQTDGISQDLWDYVQKNTNYTPKKG